LPHSWPPQRDSVLQLAGSEPGPSPSRTKAFFSRTHARTRGSYAGGTGTTPLAVIMAWGLVPGGRFVTDDALEPSARTTPRRQQDARTAGSRVEPRPDRVLGVTNEMAVRAGNLANRRPRQTRQLEDRDTGGERLAREGVAHAGLDLSRRDRCGFCATPVTHQHTTFGQSPVSYLNEIASFTL